MNTVEEEYHMLHLRLNSSNITIQALTLIWKEYFGTSVIPIVIDITCNAKFCHTLSGVPGLCCHIDLGWLCTVCMHSKCTRLSYLLLGWSIVIPRLWLQFRLSVLCQYCVYSALFTEKMKIDRCDPHSFQSFSREQRGVK